MEVVVEVEVEVVVVVVMVVKVAGVKVVGIQCYFAVIAVNVTMSFASCLDCRYLLLLDSHGVAQNARSAKFVVWCMQTMK